MPQHVAESCSIDSFKFNIKNFNSWLPLGLGVWLKGTRTAAISVVGLSFLGLQYTHSRLSPLISVFGILDLDL